MSRNRKTYIKLTKQEEVLLKQYDISRQLLESAKKEAAAERDSNEIAFARYKIALENRASRMKVFW